MQTVVELPVLAAGAHNALVLVAVGDVLPLGALAPAVEAGHAVAVHKRGR